jgi:hypothetical protein
MSGTAASAQAEKTASCSAFTTTARAARAVVR